MDVKTALRQAREASRSLLRLDADFVDKVLLAVADALESAIPNILEANAEDLARMDPNDPKYDRLKLDGKRIKGIASDMRDVAALPSPYRQIDSRVRPNGLRVRRVSVPFGVIGVIYESRPNVTADVFSLCFKSGNSCVLKGGHDADSSNKAIANVIHSVLVAMDVDPHALVLLPSTREASDQLLSARGMVDLIIPRGSAALIRSVREKSQVPVIETGAGVCHCYIDSSADVEMAARLVENAKTRRVSVCNALDCVLCHRTQLPKLAEICCRLIDSKVVIHADADAYAALKGEYPEELLCQIQTEDYGKEYLAYEMAILAVDDMDGALAHIQKYGSGHSESIITKDAQAGERFQRDVDAACVYVNAPTSFTDGAQLGLGAEIGISTQKLHARGPMGLEELMSYKWLINGEGQVRPK